MPDTELGSSSCGPGRIKFWRRAGGVVQIYVDDELQVTWSIAQFRRWLKELRRWVQP